jgi:alkanesulfonate monooxygenase SsuD/methylene tetrahydromethanopterin reductase-like flavin-dependent oxidoreductase (luciferase family)
MNIRVTLSITERVQDVVWIARQAEALGFDSIWVAEHPMIPIDYAHFPNSADSRVPEMWARWAGSLRESRSRGGGDQSP